jgi:hypothetical protein
MIRYFLIILLLSISIGIHSQDIDISSLIDSLPLIEDRYPGGAQKLTEFLAKNARYPEEAAENNIIGLSLSSITITPDGSIHNISIINSLGESIDYEIIRLLSLTKKYWLKTNQINHNQTFYFQIFFILSPFEYSSATISAFNVMESIWISAYGIISPEYAKRILIPDEDLIEKIAASITEKDYPRAIEYLDEKIRRNPFDLKVYQLRIFCYQKLGLKDKIVEDAEKINSFINNQPLDFYIINEN